MAKQIAAHTPQLVSPLRPTSSGSSRPASAWSPADDEILVNARASGLNWQPIASKHFPSKTANACRKRHERLMERRNALDWEGKRLETLALEYMNVRQEMWSVLANRLGEKWQVVEQKCMEKGMKNLQAAHRSAQRKQRGIADCEGDSGLGYSEGEDMDEPQDTSENIHHDQEVHPPTQQRGGGPSIQSMLSPTPNP